MSIIPTLTSPPAAGSNVSVPLNYFLATDQTGSGLGATTYTDICSNQTFTKARSGSNLLVIVGGNVSVGGSGALNYSTQIVIDSAGTPITGFIGGGIAYPQDENALQGSGGIYLTGIAAGSHTIKVQLYTYQSGGAFLCRASSLPALESLNILILEIGG